MLFATLGQHSTDPRDKIYSVIGLASEPQQKQLFSLIDYNLSTSDVFVRVAKYILTHYRNLDLLSLRPPSRFIDRCPNTNSLPTWVFDWSYKGSLGIFGKGIFAPSLIPELYQNPALGMGIRRVIEPYSTGGRNSPTPYNFSENSRILEVPGILFDEVKALSTLPMTRYTKGDFSQWKGMIEELGSNCYVNGCGVWEAFWRTMLLI